MSNGLFDKEQVNGAGRMHCAQCGKPVAGNVKFCGACGAPVPQRTCPACGRANGPQAKFCANCGQTLVAPTAAPAPVPTRAAVSAPPMSVVRPPTDVDSPAGLPSEIGPVARASTWSTQPGDKPAPVRAAGVEDPAPPETAATRTALPPASPPVVAPAPARNLKPLLIGVGALGVALLIGTAGYAYWRGIIGDRPGSIAAELTAELKQQGFDEVAVAMGKDWIAMVSGSVVGQDRKQALETALLGRSEIAGISLDALEVRPSRAEILDAITQGLTANRLGHIRAEVDETGSVVLVGRAERERDSARASDIAMSVPGVGAVDPRIGKPYSVIEREINQALRAAGFARVRARIASLEEVTVSGTLRSDGDRTAVVARVADTASALGETIDATRIRDEMTVEAPVLAVPPPRQTRAAPPSAPTAAFESAPSPPVAPPVVGTWGGQIRWGIVGSRAALRVDDATVGGEAGRTEYFGSYLYCRGSLRLLAVSGDEYTFEETVTEKNPRATCPGGGTVTLVLTTHDTASVKWMRSNKLSAVRYKGTLTRQ